MNAARSIPGFSFLALGLSLTAWLVANAAQADEQAGLRERALKLNTVTGALPIQGQVIVLAEDEANARRLLAVAVQMAKRKDQPFNINGTYILARLAQRLKDVTAAEIFYRLNADQARKLGSGYKLALAYNGLIDTLFENKMFAQTEKVCQEFIKFMGDDSALAGMDDRFRASVEHRMIQALSRQGKLDQALKMVEAFIKEDPANWLRLELKGSILREAGRYAEAVKIYEDVLDRVRKDKGLTGAQRTLFANEVRYILSGIYVEVNKVNKAVDCLRVLLENDPNNAAYNNDLGYIMADHDMNLEESEKLIRKAIELDRKNQLKENPDLRPEEVKDNSAYLDSLGWVLFKQKKYKEAKPYLQRAAKDKDGQHLEIYDHLGDVHMALGEKSEAIAAWKKGLEFAGTNKREQERKAKVEAKIRAAETLHSQQK